MSAIPMVKVAAKSERGWRWINECDFDPKVHSVYGAKAQADLEPEPEKRGPGRPKSKG